MEEDFVKYLGGFFDADGSVYISNNLLRIRFSQSEKKILDKINAFYNNIFRIVTRNKIDKENQRTEFSLDLSGLKLLPVLQDLEKSCITKYPQILKALEFTKYVNKPGTKDIKTKIENEMKHMNRNKDDYIAIRPYERVNIQYISGMFDGDGYVGINERGIGCHITQKNDYKLLEMIHSYFPESRLTDIRLYFYNINLIEYFLESILPYVIYKKEQVQKTLQYLNSDNNCEKEILRQSVKSLKKVNIDTESYIDYIKNIFEDINNNYTYNELLLNKKYLEMSHVRNQNNFNNKIFNDFDIFKIKPKLIFCETVQEHRLWMYYRNITSSIPYNGTVGRNIRILVQDELSEKFIGVIALSSDLYNISCRDNYIQDITNIKLENYINYIANLSCCLPLQPFGYNTNGGKLLANLAFSREVFDYWLKKYNTPLLGISTMSINGKSILYDRLKCLKFLGFSKGMSAVHIPKEVIEVCKILHTHLGLKITRVGTSDLIKSLLNNLKLTQKYLNHEVKRGYYYGFMFSTKFQENYNKDELKSIDEIHDNWLNRWCKNRLNNIKSQNRLKIELEFYHYDSKVFDNLKTYNLPSNKTIHLVRTKEEPQKQIKNEVELRILKRCNKEHYMEMITLYSKKTTEEISNHIKEKYDIIVPRNEISKFFNGLLDLPESISNTEEYKNMLQNSKKRTYKKPKSDKFIKIASKSKNRKIKEEDYIKIMRDKIIAKSAKECGLKYHMLCDDDKCISETSIQKIWSGKILPLYELNEEYNKLLNYKRARKKLI